jgi:single-strand DNA-binding protein
MVNRVVVEGRLMRNAEFRTLPSGRQVARVVLVHTRKYQDKKKEWKEELSFFEVNVYSPALVEKVKKLGKGDRIVVEGELKQERWTANNKTQSKVRIKATKLQLISKPKTVKKQTLAHS